MAKGLSDWLGKSDQTINLDNVNPNGPCKTLTQSEMDWARSPTPFPFTPNWYITQPAKALAKQKCQMALTNDVSDDTDQAHRVDISDAHARNDFIITGRTTDRVDAGAGNDLIHTGIHTGSGNNTIRGGSGGDRILAGNGNDLVYGGSGDDDISGDSALVVKSSSWLGPNEKIMATVGYHGGLQATNSSANNCIYASST